MATIVVTNLRRVSAVTPEIYFYKPIDNSRLVKVADPERRKEMTALLGALAVLFVLFMVFCWQHYSAIEYGYRNEALRQQREQLLEARRQWTLQESQLLAPGRIDLLAHQMGLQAPLAGQVLRLDATLPNQSAMPVMARVAAVSVVSTTE